MREAADRTITLADVSPAVLRALLIYIYTVSVQGWRMVVAVGLSLLSSHPCRTADSAHRPHHDNSHFNQKK